MAMKENENTVSGYSFSDARDFREAKREAETIEYIKANTDISDMNKALKLYHKLVERRTLKTIVGYEFLKGLQDRILAAGIVSKDNLPGIRIEREKEIRAYTSQQNQDQEQRHLAMVEDYRIKLRNSRIINIFLVVIIIVMIFIAIINDRSLFVDYENNILNKYSAWEEDLQARENALQEKETQ
jgi:hypothetical protein